MIYPFLIENVVMPSVGVLTHSGFWKIAQDMSRLEVGPVAEVQSRQWGATKALLAMASRDVPQYRERFAEAGLDPGGLRGPDDLARLRPLSRREIAANFPDRATSGESRPDWRFAATSGTTAQRLVVIQDFAKRDAIRAAAAHSFRFAGLPLGSRSVEIPPDICTVRCGLNRMAEPTFREFLGELRKSGWRDREVRSAARGLMERRVVFRRTILPSFGGRGTDQPRAAIEGLIEQVRALRPAVLKALPAYLLTMARHRARSGGGPLSPDLREIRPMGSVMPDSARRLIVQGLGCEVIEDYGTAELGPIGSACAPGRGMHLLSPLFHLEFVRDGRPVGPGVVGRILVTDLSNRAMPLIRYEVGDLGSPIAGPCPCGRTTPRFRVLGRLADAIVGPDGRVWTEHDIADFLYSYPGVAWFQLIERPGRSFDLSIVPDRGPDGIPSTLARDLGEFLGGDNRINVRAVTSIVPETGGKFRFVKSASHQRFDDPPGANANAARPEPTPGRPEVLG